MPKVGEIKLAMKYSKSTKNTHVYVNEDTESAIPTLYIKHKNLPVKAPTRIDILVSFDQ